MATLKNHIKILKGVDPDSYIELNTISPPDSVHAVPLSNVIVKYAELNIDHFNHSLSE